MVSRPPRDEPPSPGIGGSAERAILRFDEWLDFFKQHLAVTVGFAAAHLFVARRCVLAKTPLAGVVDAHDNERTNRAQGDQLISSVLHVPIHAGDEGGRPIEKILAILQVKHRIARLRIFLVAWRKIDDQVARARKKSRAILFVLA